MKIIVQRSTNSKVIVEKQIVGSIDNGLVLLVGFTHNDTIKDINYLVNKIINLRIFNDEENKMNKSIMDIKGSVLSIPQFTLYANTKKGNRPSYVEAMDALTARELFDLFNEKLSQYVLVETGIFQEDMLVSINNNGPITIILESN